MSKWVGAMAMVGAMATFSEILILEFVENLRGMGHGDVAMAPPSPVAPQKNKRPFGDLLQTNHAIRCILMARHEINPRPRSQENVPSWKSENVILYQIEI